MPILALAQTHAHVILGTHQLDQHVLSLIIVKRITLAVIRTVFMTDLEHHTARVTPATHQLGQLVLPSITVSAAMADVRRTALLTAQPSLTVLAIAGLLAWGQGAWL